MIKCSPQNDQISRRNINTYFGLLIKESVSINISIKRSGVEVMDVKELQTEWRLSFFKYPLIKSCYNIEYGEDFLKEDTNIKMGFNNK